MDDVRDDVPSVLMYPDQVVMGRMEVTMDNEVQPRGRDRRRGTDRTVRTVRVVRARTGRTGRRVQTTSRRRRVSTSRRKGLAIQVREALHACSVPGRSGTTVIIKVSLAAIGIVLCLSLMALGVLYLLYRPPAPLPSSPVEGMDDAMDREYHVINGRVIIMKKSRRGADSE